MASRFLLFLAGSLLWAGLVLAQINVNSASKEQLDSLKGIGPVKAQAIIDYRRQHGPFNSVDELEKVPGIGPETLKDIRGKVMVSGPAATTTKAAPSAKPAPARPATPATPSAVTAKSAPAAPAMPARPAGMTPATPAPPAMPAKPATPAPAMPPAPAKPAQPARPPAN